MTSGTRPRRQHPPHKHEAAVRARLTPSAALPTLRSGQLASTSADIGDPGPLQECSRNKRKYQQWQQVWF